MSGAVAAHAAYNGSGTQGLAVTNKIHDDDGDVMSVFWNKNDTTRQLLYGSAFVEVPASGGSGTSFISTTNSVIFDVNNDIDCLGDMYLKILYTCAGAAQTLAWAPQQLALSIGRVEIMVGTQIWQTLEQADLLALLSTELSSGSHSDFSFQATGGVGLDGQYINGFPTGTNAGPTAADQTTEQILYIPLKMLTKTLTSRLENFAEQSEDGYLMAAAPHQQVKVKVFTAKFSDNSSAQSTIKLSLYAKNQVMCNEEREQIKAMPMGLPKRIKMTQNKFLSVPTSGKTMDIDLDHFSLYASHIIISLPVKPPTYAGVLTTDAFPQDATFTPTFSSTGQITAIAVATAGAGYPANSQVTLKITLGASNTTNASGAVAETTTDANGSFTNPVTITGTQTGTYASGDAVTVPTAFINTDRTTQLQPVNLGTAELLLNSSSYSGKLPLGLLKQTGPSMGLYTNEYWIEGANHSAYVTYVFPLASRAYGGSSVPLNRFDNIRLKLTFPTDIINFTQASENINITCVGETTALYKGGAASLAMY
jgi:hypothetical protein